MSRSADRLQASQAASATGYAPGSASGTVAIETHGLSKHFGKLTAVDGLTFSVPAGTIAGFIGPNGAGKTTTIRLLLGLVRPDAGSATILGQPLTNSLGYLPRVGALIEAPAFYPSLSARANLEVLARLGGYPSSRVREVLDLVELSDRARDRVGSYSLGMKQRLAIASCLLGDPEVMVFDEPTNGLDPVGIAEIRELIKKLHQEGKTIIMASHLLDEVEKVCTHAAILRTGELLITGRVEEILVDDDVVELSAADLNALANLLQQLNKNVVIDAKLKIVHITFPKGTARLDEINSFCFKNGIILNHLIMKKKRLEARFFELTNN